MIKLFLYLFIFYLVYQFFKLIVVLSKSKPRQNFTVNKDQEQKKEGETTIQYIPENNRKNSSNPSEKDDYIDYQELK